MKHVVLRLFYFISFVILHNLKNDNKKKQKLKFVFLLKFAFFLLEVFLSYIFRISVKHISLHSLAKRPDLL